MYLRLSEVRSSSWIAAFTSFLILSHHSAFSFTLIGYKLPHYLCQSFVMKGRVFCYTWNFVSLDFQRFLKLCFLSQNLGNENRLCYYNHESIDSTPSPPTPSVQSLYDRETFNEQQTVESPITVTHTSMHILTTGWFSFLFSVVEAVFKPKWFYIGNIFQIQRHRSDLIVGNYVPTSIFKDSFKSLWLSTGKNIFISHRLKWTFSRLCMSRQVMVIDHLYKA